MHVFFKYLISHLLDLFLYLGAYLELVLLLNQVSQFLVHLNLFFPDFIFFIIFDLLWDLFYFWHNLFLVFFNFSFSELVSVLTIFFKHIFNIMLRSNMVCHQISPLPPVEYVWVQGVDLAIFTDCVVILFFSSASLTIWLFWLWSVFFLDELVYCFVVITRVVTSYIVFF